MKTKKILALALCAVLLVAGSVLGTMAYLTAVDTVTNTFTVGNVAITLDEQDVDNSTEGENDRDKANSYKLIPGQTYTKDPQIHVDSTSEDCWLFVKVENGISAIEAAGDTTIAAQMAANGWTLVEGSTDTYAHKDIAKAGANVDVFKTFKLAGNANVAQYTNANITVTAYAVQAAGFESAAEAWTATYGAPAA